MATGKSPSAGNQFTGSRDSLRFDFSSADSPPPKLSLSPDQLNYCHQALGVFKEKIQDPDSISREFANLQDVAIGDAVAMNSVNSEKNRYRDVLPFDKNMIVLNPSTDRRRPQGGGGGGGGGKDRIDALGRLLTRILRHKATELSLNMRGDGFVKVKDLLKLNLKTCANLQLKSHTVDEIREAVRRDNKQRFSLIEENGELLIRANQGHSVAMVETEKLLKPILSAEEAPVCVHGTYRKNLESILASGLKRMNRLHVHFSCGLPTDGEVISGMRRNVNVVIFLDIKKALEDGIAFYISNNKVILTEGIDGAVPVDYFLKIESWPSQQPIPF